jgi:uncharacterized membrane protein YbhN (UPF0104 family)
MKRPRPAGRGVLILVGLLLAVVCGWLALREVQLERLGTLLGTARPLPLLLGAALIPVTVWLKALELQALCRPPGSAGLRGLVTATGLGLAVNNLAPARLGDGVRLMVAARLSELPLVRLGASMVLEKLLDVLSLALLGGLLLLTMPLPAVLAGVVRTVGCGSLLGLGALGLAVARRDVLGGLTPRLPTRARQAAGPLLALLASALEGLDSFGDPRRLVWPLTLALAHWLVNAALFALTFDALGLDLPPSAPLLVLLATQLGLALPSSPGFVGVLDYLCVVSLAVFGVGPTDALGVAVIMHGYGVVVAPLVALLLLVGEPRRRQVSPALYPASSPHA